MNTRGRRDSGSFNAGDDLDVDSGIGGGAKANDGISRDDVDVGSGDEAGGSGWGSGIGCGTGCGIDT